MAVIRPEMISRDITRKDVLPLSFLKKSAYTGSKRRMNYKMEKAEVPVEPVPETAGAKAADAANAPEPEMKKVLRVYAWPGPFAFDTTEKEKISRIDMSFNDQGIEDAIGWLNERLK